MSDQQPAIAAIWYPVYDPAQPLIVHAVGREGVTKILDETYSPEPYCTRTVYDVYVNDVLRWRLAGDKAGVEYAPPPLSGSTSK